MNLKEIIEKSTPGPVEIRDTKIISTSHYFSPPIPDFDDGILTTVVDCRGAMSGADCSADKARLAFGYNIVPLWPKIIEAYETALSAYLSGGPEQVRICTEAHEKLLKEAKKVKP